MNAAHIVIGSRSSTLALVQTETVAGLLRAAHTGLDLTVVTIATTGDRNLESPLSEIGDKSLFTNELESALLEGGIDSAVHSAKDLPTALPAGCAVGPITRRADPRDVVAAVGAAQPSASTVGAAPGGSGSASHPLGFAAPPGGLAALPARARLGSSSLRRRSQLLALRPDLELVDLRGNVETRLRKVVEQDLDGTVLAAAGLERLGRTDLAAFAFSFEQMLPAVGQGALAVEIRASDERVAALPACLHDGLGALAVHAKRTLLGALQGGCQIPIGAHAELRSAKLTLRAYVGSLDGTQSVRDSLAGAAAAPEALGRALAERLRAAGAGGILAEVRDVEGAAPGSGR